MLYFVLTISILHLLWMNWLIYRKADTTACLFSAFAPFVVGFCVPSLVILIQPFVMTALVVLHWRLFPNRRLAFSASSLLVVFCLFAIATWLAVSTQHDLIERFPMESMAERVPAPSRNIRLAPVAERKDWSNLQALISEDLQEHERGFYSRTKELQRLHEETTQNFIHSPGFGVTRGMSGNVNPRRLEFRNENESPVDPMEKSEPLIFSSQDLEKPYQGTLLSDLTSLHFGGLRDFLNVQGFGYIKDRQHVAGFYSHQFSKWPGAWNVTVQRLELVSLLMHNKPVVYVTNELPRMKELKKAPTRGLSDFEAKGLEALQNGDDLFVREIESTIHLLGAIRSVKQCVTCHGGDINQVVKNTTHR